MISLAMPLVALAVGTTMPAHLLATAGLRQAAAARSGPVADSLIVRRVDEYMGRIAGRGFNGGVLVVRDGRVVVENSWGFANRDAGIRADARTVYNIGSITKQFTAAAILRLEELGKLHTTDSIARFFPQAPADKRHITLHQLLTHTAGFESDFAPTDYDPNTRDEYIGRMLAAPLRSPPGTEFSYANSGYSMLAAIIEIVTGKEYEQALTDLVLAPAGMTETGYTAPHWAKDRIAHGYEDGSDWGTIVDRITGPGRPYWALRGNGGLGTTLGDFARWDAALRSNRVLTDSSLRKFMTGYVNEGPQGRSKYAYGWAVTTTPRGTRLVTHNGGNGVYVAEWLRYVDEGVAIFVTSTNADIRATPVSQVVSHIVFGEPYELPPRAVAAGAAALSAMAGTWRLPGGG
ncbi:MAG: serine hydrolase domain-containing protein, partial [Gemmatimonadota bacterium]|nr:serine hydrolase domain-containing protein [Gemmatimonadota bacterium]